MNCVETVYVTNYESDLPYSSSIVRLPVYVTERASSRLLTRRAILYSVRRLVGSRPGQSGLFSLTLRHSGRQPFPDTSLAFHYSLTILSLGGGGRNSDHETTEAVFRIPSTSLFINHLIKPKYIRRTTYARINSVGCQSRDVQTDLVRYCVCV
jgi:hypothetical protein